jgi:serine/threonine-protein kinase
MNTSSSPARLRPFRPVPFGRYTLLSQLATGGMGEIFLARLEGVQGFEKLCVIKKILPQLAADPEFVERFVGEARTLVKLSHGSIAQVLDMGLNEGEAYMALEHVDGKDLRKVAARARDRQLPLPLTFVLFVMGRVLDALAYAHRKKGDDEGELNLVHRDISPQNILISYEGEVKVIDFGLAKSRLSAAKTNPSIILGKFLYMSPEQARHQPVDRRSDLYAVGLCLYELIAGRNPFDLLPPGELMSAVAQPNIPPLGGVVPSLPPAVAQLVMKALALEPSQRFQSAEELRGKLNACLLELDPSSGPESVSRYMHELFAADYQAERRLLASLKEAGRPPEPEPVVIGMPEGAPPRPVPTLPPKTIRLDGAVEPLSFRPTPRTREGGPVRDDNETRRAVVDEPTRPAVPMESVEESARGRPSPMMGSPTVEVSGLDVAPRVPTSPRPIPAPFAPAGPGPVAPRAAAPSAPPVPNPEARSEARRPPAAPSAPPVLTPEMSSDVRRALAAQASAQPGATTSPTREVPVSSSMLRASTPPGASAPPASRATPPPPSSNSLSPTRELPVSSGPGPSYGALSSPPQGPQSSPMDISQLPIEDTPAWSEALSADEDLSAIEASRDSGMAPPVASEAEESAWDASEARGEHPGADEEPVPAWDAEAQEEDPDAADIVPGVELEGSDEGAVDVRMEDTHPRIQLPHPSHEDTQPRVSLSDVYRQGNAPRVVVDESPGRSEEPEEVSQSGRSRPGGARVVRRRVTSTGTPAVAARSTSTSRMVAVATRGGDVEEGASGEEDSLSSRREVTQRTLMPTRPGRPWLWIALGLGLMLLGGGAGAIAFVLMHKPEPEVKPPPARPLFPPGSRATQTPTPKPPTPSVPAAAAPAATVEAAPVNPPGPADSAPTAPADTVTAEATAAPQEDSARLKEETTPEAPSEALAAAPAPAGAEAAPEVEAAPEADPAPVEPAGDPLLLAPLTPSPEASAPTGTKRPAQLRKRSSSRYQSTLQKEWARTKSAFLALNKVVACENLDLLCTRYEDLKAEVAGMGDVEDGQLLNNVRALRRDILKKRGGGQ